MIYVVGCNHGIQLEPSGPFAALDGDDQQKQRALFAALLGDILKKGEIQFVGEEWGDVEPTIADVLAKKCNIPYKNVNTSETDKKRLGIPCNYVEGPFSEEQKEQWHRQREQFMFERIREYRGAARNLLVVCGFTHEERLSSLLVQEGTRPERIDYRKCSWYRPRVFDGDS